jgi:hypothetical protein
MTLLLNGTTEANIRNLSYSDYSTTFVYISLAFLISKQRWCIVCIKSLTFAFVIAFHACNIAAFSRLEFLCTLRMQCT